MASVGSLYGSHRSPPLRMLQRSTSNLSSVQKDESFDPGQWQATVDIIKEERTQEDVHKAGEVSFFKEHVVKDEQTGEHVNQPAPHCKEADIDEHANGGSSLRVENSASGMLHGESSASIMKLAHAKDPLSPLNAVLIFLGIAVPNAVMIIAYSEMCFGMHLFSAFAKRGFSLLGDACFTGGALLGVTMIIFDWWKLKFPSPIKIATACIPGAVFYLGSILKTRKYPWGPMILTLAAMPASLGLIRFACCSNVRQKQFYATVSFAAYVVAVVVTAIWLIHLFANDSMWTDDTQYRLIGEAQPLYDNAYAERPLVYSADCGPDKDLRGKSTLQKAQIKQACSQAGTVWLLAWMCPLITLISDLLLAAFSFATGVVGSFESASDVQSFLTRFLLAIGFLLSGIYATSTMSATSIRLGSTVLAFFMAALVLEFAWAYLELDLTLLAAAAKKSKLVQQVLKAWESDWSKAMAIAPMSVPLLVFLGVNYLTQRVRVWRNLSHDANAHFTPLALGLLKELATWKWTSILVKICLLAELYFTMQVGVSKATYVFLSWLNSLLSDLSLEVVMVLVFIVGGTMFLLPPVPGLPVYVFAGILIAERARKTEGVGFWLGCVLAAALGLFTKLIACCGQYMIGYFLGMSVKVQQLIGVDKIFTRAVEEVLKRPGLDRGKVAVLIGGPDWPVSVTCGIIRVNIPQMLFGTLPVVILLAPCVIAGACLGRVSPGEDNMWNMMANAAIAVSAAVNMVSFAYAVYVISKVMRDNGDELAKPRPEHAKVEELTRQETAMRDAYAAATDWANLTPTWKAVLLSMTALMLLSNTIFTVLSETCFRPFAVSSKIDDPYENDGLNGNFLSIVLPLGWFSLVLFFVAAVLHMIFIRAMQKKAKKLVEARQSPGSGS